MRRKIDGVLLLDKPAGMTSNAALQKAKWLLQAKKAGHTGTLDPFATGLLPLCFGEATKFSQYLLESDKVYLAVMQLGVRTSTGDPEGEVIERHAVAVNEAAVRQALPDFVGVILQTPPMHSALKRDGQPLYKLARQGIEVERAARRVVVHSLDFVAMEGDLVTLRVHCGKGLYVRTLAEDIGAKLGCGAHLQTLRREAVGPFQIGAAVTLTELDTLDPAERENCLAGLDCLVEGLPRMDLDVNSASQLLHGQSIWRAGLSVGDRFRLYGPDGGFLGVAEVDLEGKAAPKRLLAMESPGCLQP